MSGESGRQHWNKGSRHRTVDASSEREDSRLNLWEDVETGDRKANSQIFCQVMKNQELDIVEGSAPSKMEKEIVHRVGARNMAALTT
jgi:hypothetical protein